MELKIIDIVTPQYGEEAFRNFQKQNPGIKISTKHICPHQQPERLKGHDEFTGYDRLYIFYETASDVEYIRNRDTIEQDAALDMCRDIARAIYNNSDEWKIYRQLKNAEQRRIFLLDEHNIPKADADMVQEILQMAKIGALRGMNLKEEHTK